MSDVYVCRVSPLALSALTLLAPAQPAKQRITQFELAVLQSEYTTYGVMCGGQLQTLLQINELNY